MKQPDQKAEPTDDKENPTKKLDRRTFLRLGTLGAIGGSPCWGASVAQAAETPKPTVSDPPSPIVDARFPCRIADGIWLIPDKRIFLVPNIGVIEGSKSVLVIDSGLTPGSGRSVLDAARSIAGKRELILTVTHAHPEHTFGAQAFKDEARIYYNRLQRDYLVHSGQKLLEGFRKILPADRVHLIEDVRITPADDAYDGSRSTLDLGGRIVEFETWDTAHSPGDQIIKIPDAGVIFVGDLIEERMFPIVPFFPPLITAAEIDVHKWQTALSTIEAAAPKLIVPGHGNLGGIEIAGAVKNYLDNLRELVNSGSTGKTSGGSNMVSALRELVQTRYPTWEHVEFIAPALRYFLERADA
jgi:glyoxylase-like metal-dependent hydrolase (beta-lactamase superfamily II)